MAATDNQINIRRDAARGATLLANPDYNYCELIVMDRSNIKYAKLIEERLKRLILRVNILFPNGEVPLGMLLANITLRGCLYAVQITPQHEEHSSITVNILYGHTEEHRNMPVEDAIKLIAVDFDKKMAMDTVNLSNEMEPAVRQLMPTTVSLVSTTFMDLYPDIIQILLNRLSNNILLTVPQYDRVINYLQERRGLQLQMETTERAAVSETMPDPEITMQKKKTCSSFNNPSVAESYYELLYPNLQSVKEDSALVELLQDVRVQRALDSLVDSSLAATIENYMKF